MSTETPMPVTIKAWAGDTLGESLTVEVPVEWHERVRALERFTCYGTHYCRGTVEHLQRMDLALHRGYSSIAYDHLLAAERAAGITHDPA